MLVVLKVWMGEWDDYGVMVRDWYGLIWQVEVKFVYVG